MTNAPDKKPATEKKPLTDPSPIVEKLSEEELRKRYLEQQARRACPGCGEEPFLG